MKKQQITVTVSKRALLQRVNRALVKENARLKSCRETAMQYETLGDFYRVDEEHNCIVKKDVDLVSIAKELGVIADWERLEE